jgi:hypothetical protein
MWVTIHVAVVASLIRYVNGSRGSQASLFLWVLISIAVASLILWPLTRMVIDEWNAEDDDLERTCPRCRRYNLRPLISSGEGIFESVDSFRCPGCRTTVRVVDGSKVIEDPIDREQPAFESGIQFLDEPLTGDEIRFLDEAPKSTG